MTQTMSEPLRMIQLAIVPARLYAWARLSGMTLRDQGYLVHAALRKAFGTAAPQPFVVLETNRSASAPELLTVLGYGRADKNSLAQHMAEVAQPLLSEALPGDYMAHKDMPQAWPSGSRFGFRVSCCPIVRTSGGAEKDVYLVAMERAQDGEQPDREAAYTAWLRRELGRNDAAELLSTSMRAFRLVQPMRRKERGAPPSTIRTRPETVLEGTLAVRDGAGFAALLERGVGRHRAFGYGMLLLSPSKE